MINYNHGDLSNLTMHLIYINKPRKHAKRANIVLIWQKTDTNIMDLCKMFAWITFKRH